MKLANKPCYPTMHEMMEQDNQTGERKFFYPQYVEGLTFKERLVIALASNPAIFSTPDGLPNTYSEISVRENTNYCINQADAIIAELEKEK